MRRQRRIQAADRPPIASGRTPGRSRPNNQVHVPEGELPKRMVDGGLGRVSERTVLDVPTTPTIWCASPYQPSAQRADHMRFEKNDLANRIALGQSRRARTSFTMTTPGASGVSRHRRPGRRSRAHPRSKVAFVHRVICAMALRRPSARGCRRPGKEAPRRFERKKFVAPAERPRVGADLSRRARRTCHRRPGRHRHPSGRPVAGWRSRRLPAGRPDSHRAAGRSCARETGAHEQHHRQGDLGDDERASRATAGRGCAEAASAFLQRLRQVRPGREQRRRQAENQRGCHRHDRSEAEHRPVDRHLIEAG